MPGLRYRVMMKYQRLRILKYRFFSTCENVVGKPIVYQPIHCVGKGTIKFNGTVKLGVYPSPFFFSGYIYLEARYPDSIIEIGDGVWFNNSVALISAGPGIFIGSRTTLGTHCEIVDSDFHDMHPDRRMTGVPKTAKVVLGENVFVASNVKILKGVEIGNNSIIANGAIVTRPFPDNVVVGGNPAKVVQRLESE